MDLVQAAGRLKENIGRVIVGKEDVIDLLLIALLCEGHVLLEDVPGLGKTALARALARSIGCSFGRIQCTPDLLPSDVTGISFYNQKGGEFEYRPGPVMAQIVLADEINRATPRTQSSLLECMQERQVTVDGVTRPLPRPFLVLATQNPVEMEGTFPLPEAQLDRFLMRIRLGYPDREDERQILRRFRDADPLASLQPVLGVDDVLDMQTGFRRVHVAPDIEGYIVDLCRGTRRHADIELGVSPRGTLALHSTCQARAALNGRDYVIPDDAKVLAEPVLAHRLIISVNARLRGRSAADILAEVVASVPVPVEAERQ